MGIPYGLGRDLNPPLQTASSTRNRGATARQSEDNGWGFGIPHGPKHSPLRTRMSYHYKPVSQFDQTQGGRWCLRLSVRCGVVCFTA